MKFKTLIKKETNEFVEILNIGGTDIAFTSDIPCLTFPMTATFDGLKKHYNLVDFDDYELVEYRLIKSDEVGADIRNKLSPIKNFAKIVENMENDLDKRDILFKFALKELKTVNKSINYLAKLFE